MRNIKLVISSNQGDSISGNVFINGSVAFRAVAEYDPREGIRASYPWVVYLPGRECIPQRFLTFTGARREVEALAIRQFHLLTEDDERVDTVKELERMLDDIAPLS